MPRFKITLGDLSIQLCPQALLSFNKPINKALYLLKEQIVFESDTVGTITVPVGFISDLATIPKPLHPLFMCSDDPRIALGAWVHDYLYANKLFTRQQCDYILAYECMPCLLAKPWHCFTVYWALRIFGDRF